MCIKQKWLGERTDVKAVKAVNVFDGYVIGGIASTSDPKMEMLSDFIEARVSFAPAAPAYIKRDDLIERFKSSIRQTDMATFRAAFNGVSAADFKRLADKAMDPFGRKFLEDSARAGVGRVRRGYAECEFNEDAIEYAD